MRETVIDIQNVCKVYRLYDNPMERLRDALNLSFKKEHKEYYALNNVSFYVEKGSSVGLIGTNGAGKSTLLKILTGVITPSSGQIIVNGKIAALLELGAGFNMEYTGLENVYLNGSMMGYTKEQMHEKINDIIDFAGIGDYINQPVKTYSSGMFARLAFAVSINVEPDILIVDEALSVGDIYFQAKCFNKMEEIKKSGTTILMVTHDMSSVIKYCDHVVVLNKGEVLKQGNPKEMVDIYKKLLVNQYSDYYDDNENNSDESDGLISKFEDTDKNIIWKNNLRLNNENVSYGSKKAEIIDFGIFDNYGKLNTIIEKKEQFCIKMKVLFNQDVENPIFALTFKDAKGTEITGTNSMFERKDVRYAKKGDVFEITFSQKMLLQGGEYLLSFGCTGFENEDFTVYHRLYDITNITVISKQNTVGFFDMDTEVSINKL